MSYIKRRDICMYACMYVCINNAFYIKNIIVE